ncbi:MAG: hypothetical protein KTR21_18180, partial [Rhodobacteraceae bacterium]|nr:hypothetical protein [Paracoccaceae bacterium]
CAVREGERKLQRALLMRAALGRKKRAKTTLHSIAPTNMGCVFMITGRMRGRSMACRVIARVFRHGMSRVVMPGMMSRRGTFHRDAQWHARHVHTMDHRRRRKDGDQRCSERCSVPCKVASKERDHFRDKPFATPSPDNHCIASALKRHQSR